MMLKKILKSFSEKQLDVIERIDLGNGYFLVRTHAMLPDVATMGQGYGHKEFYEIRHSAASQLLAALEAVTNTDKEPIIKVGYISPEHKALNIAKNIIEALTLKYGKIPLETQQYFETVWGGQETPIAPTPKGKWSPVTEAIKNLMQTKPLLKSDKPKQYIQVEGDDSWHELLDIKDTKLPATHPEGGNAYTFKHAKTGETKTVNQKQVTDHKFGE